MAAEIIPNYRLYGERGDQADVEFVHCESIAQRSVIHNWNIRPHRHDTLYQLFCLTAGGGRMQLEEATLALPVPGMLMIPPMVVHGFRFRPGTEGTVVTINARGMDRILAAAPALLSELAAPRVVHAGDGGVEFAEVERLFRRIAAEFAGHDAGRLCALQSYLGLAFVQLARSAAPAARGRLSVADRRLELLRRFRELVEQRFRDHLPVPGYAAALGITPTHLNRVCRALLDRSALAVVHDRLLLESKRSLVYTSMSVKEVSNLLGFSDPGYFTRFFTRHTGTSPSAFRAASRDAARGRARAA